MEDLTYIEIEELKENLNKEVGDLSFIGERLKEIREELKSKGDQTCKTENINKIIFGTDTDRMNLLRIENGKYGNYKNIYKLIFFYSIKGINPEWILIKENSKIKKYSKKNSKN